MVDEMVDCETDQFSSFSLFLFFLSFLVFLSEFCLFFMTISLFIYEMIKMCFPPSQPSSSSNSSSNYQPPTISFSSKISFYFSNSWNLCTMINLIIFLITFLIKFYILFFVSNEIQHEIFFPFLSQNEMMKDDEYDENAR